MKKTTPTLLTAFRHPLVIASILLLLVNDHLLKALTPSWLTGKLSDLGGLFFFPFLLGLLLEQTRCVDWKINRALAIGLTGAAFAAIKTIPLVNGGAVFLLRQLLGPTVQIIRDPSDLLTLIVLLGVFLVWGKVMHCPAPIPPGRLAYLFLGLGALGSLATSPCPVQVSIRALTALDGKVYATTSQYQVDRDQGVFVLEDNGQNWQYVKEPPPAVVQALSLPRTLPIQQCDPADARRCYRIDGSARVEQTSDGGATWQIAWRIPAARELFMYRIAIAEQCMKKPELATFDLAIAPSPAGPLVFVAAGNEGLVMRRSDGSWQRISMHNATNTRPTPIAAENLSQALNAVGNEFLLACLASLLIYTGLSIWARKAVAKGEKPPAWALHPAWFIAAWILSLLQLPLGLPLNSMARMLVAAVAEMALVIMFLVLLFTTLSTRPGSARAAGWLALIACLSAVSIPTGFFLLWAYGGIADYSTALGMAVISTALASTYLIFRYARRITARD